MKTYLTDIFQIHFRKGDTIWKCVILIYNKRSNREKSGSCISITWEDCPSSFKPPLTWSHTESMKGRHEETARENKTEPKFHSSLSLNPILLWQLRWRHEYYGPLLPFAWIVGVEKVVMINAQLLISHKNILTKPAPSRGYASIDSPEISWYNRRRDTTSWI